MRPGLRETGPLVEIAAPVAGVAGAANSNFTVPPVLLERKVRVVFVDGRLKIFG